MPTRFLPLIAVLAIQSLTALAMVAVPVLAPSAAPDLGVPVTFAGMFIGLVYLGAMWATLCSGSLVRRCGAVIGAPAIGLLSEASGSYGIGFVAVSALSALCGVALVRKRHAFCDNQR